MQMYYFHGYGALFNFPKYTDREYREFIDNIHKKYCTGGKRYEETSEDVIIERQWKHEEEEPEKPKQKSSSRSQLPPTEVDYWKDL